MLEIQFDHDAPTLRRFLGSNKFAQFVMGPLGSGKTNTFVFKVISLICQQTANANKIRRSRVFITRNTYGDLESTTIRDWRSIVGDECGPFTNGHPPEHHLDFMLEDGTRVQSEVLFIALDREDHVKRVRGTQMTFAWMNEAKEQPKVIFDMLTLRVGRYPPAQDEGCAYSGVMGDYNAPDDDHWLFELEQQWALGQLPDYEFFIQPGAVLKTATGWEVNPEAENLANLPVGYYVRGLQGKGDDFIRVNLGNQYGFVRDGMPIYPEYVDSMHCRTFEPIKGLPLRLGADFGLTPALAVAQRRANGTYRVIDELVCQDMGVKRFAEQSLLLLRERYPGYEIETATGDPAGTSRIADDEEKTVFSVMSGVGLVMKPARTNDFTRRRETVANLLTKLVDGEPALAIHPRCKVLRKGMAGKYCLKRLAVAGDARYRTEPDKNEWSHICEALQYLAIGSGEDQSVMRPMGRRRGELVVESEDSVLR